MIHLLNQPAPRPATVWDLLREMKLAIERMSATNPHRQLLIACGTVILELAEQLKAAEAALAAAGGDAPAPPVVPETEDPGA